MKFNFVNIKLSHGLNSPSRQCIMDTSNELHQIRKINKAMIWALLLLKTSNLDHICIYKVVQKVLIIKCKFKYL